MELNNEQKFSLWFVGLTLLAGTIIFTIDAIKETKMAQHGYSYDRNSSSYTKSTIQEHR